MISHLPATLSAVDDCPCEFTLSDGISPGKIFYDYGR